jgi:hypothetical protein
LLQIGLGALTIATDDVPILGGSAAAKVCKTTAQSGKTVLGHYPEYIELSNKLGARRFDIPADVWSKMTPAQQWAANQKFLDRLIKRGDEIILATPANQARPGSFYAKELEYLSSKGYQLGPDGARMILPP